MEVKVFIRMHREGQKMAAIRNIEACKIQAISIMDGEFYKGLVESFIESIPRDPAEIRRIQAEAEASVLSGNAAKNAMMTAFKRVR